MTQLEKANIALQLYSQLLSVAKIVKYVANHPRIYSLTGFGATLSSLTKEEIEALEDAFKLPLFFPAGSRSNMTNFYVREW